jgi:hypothetical protein
MKSSKVTHHPGYVGTVFSTVEDEIETHTADIASVEADVSTLQDDVDALELRLSTLGTYTALSTTSTTLTGIPTNARMVVLNIVGMSWDNTAALRIRIGPSGGVATSGYLGAFGLVTEAPTVTIANGTAGFDGPSQAATAVFHGSITFAMAQSSTNTWTCSGVLGRADAVLNFIGGSVPLSGALERITITTVAGTAAADAGSVSVLIYT